MTVPDECVIDTMVLQKANRAVAHPVGEGSPFARRLRLLKRIADGKVQVLVSEKLVAEYRRQVLAPRSDMVVAFFALIGDPRRAVFNWAKEWSGGQRERARQCRYPIEDDHVLRTAIRPDPTTIFTEEQRMLASDRCIYRNFRVHIWAP